LGEFWAAADPVVKAAQARVNVNVERALRNETEGKAKLAYTRLYRAWSGYRGWTTT